MICAPNAPPTPSAAFEKPWHGQVFALTVALNEAGHFAWPEWAKAFGAGLAKEGEERTLNGSDDYYLVWVSTLEAMMVGKKTLSSQALTEMKSAWTEAFLKTPHGAPVHPQKP